MDDITKIKALIEQNQKIIRFASASVNLQSFEDAILHVYEKDAEIRRIFSNMRRLFIDIEGKKRDNRKDTKILYQYGV